MINVSTWLGLWNIRNDKTEDYKLLNDLGPDDTGYATYGAVWESASGAGIANAFTGSLDGDGHVLRGLTGEPLFNDLRGDVSNLGLEDCDIDGAAVAQTGAIARLITDEDVVGTPAIANCYITGGVSSTGSFVGAFVGILFQCDIRNCYSSSTLASGAAGSVGGVAGIAEAGSVVNSFFIGGITAGTNREAIIGAISDTAPTVTNCYYDNAARTNVNGGTLEAIAGALQSRNHPVYRRGEADEWPRPPWIWNKGAYPLFVFIESQDVRIFSSLAAAADPTDNDPLAIIDNPMTAMLTEGLNREYVLRFSIPVDDDELAEDGVTAVWTLLKTAAEVSPAAPYVLLVGADIFDITRRTKRREQGGGLIVDVEAEHVSYRLNDKVFEDETFTDQTPAQMLTTILATTDLTSGTVEGAGTDSFQFTNETARHALIRVADAFDLDIRYDAGAISLLDFRGDPTGIDLLAGENLAVSDVADETREGGRLVLQANVAELKELAAFGAAYEFALGDQVHVLDAGLGVDAVLRVTAYTRDIINPTLSVVEIADRADRIENYFESRHTKLDIAAVKVDAFDTDITALEGRVDATELDIGTLNTALGLLDGRVEDIEEADPVEAPTEPTHTTELGVTTLGIPITRSLTAAETPDTETWTVGDVDGSANPLGAELWVCADMVYDATGGPDEDDFNVYKLMRKIVIDKYGRAWNAGEEKLVLVFETAEIPI